MPPSDSADPAGSGPEPEPVSGSGPGPGLGQRIRGVRLQLRLSTRELARRVGCSASLISQIERGATAPSASVLYLLANELDTSLDYLFGVGAASSPAPADQAPASAQSAQTVFSALDQLRAGQGRNVAIRRAGGAQDPVPERQAAPPPVADSVVQRAGSRRCIELAGGVRWERLTPASDPYVDFLEVIYEPRGGHTRQAQSVRALRHDGREYGLVLAGRLRADVGFETYELGPGDSLTFDSSTPHAYSNITDEYVTAVWFIVHREPWRA